MTLVDTVENVFEVQIDEECYQQIIGVIEATLPQNQPEPEPPVVKEPLGLTPERRDKLAAILGDVGPPLHAVEGEVDVDPRTMMASVGFDVDYSADMDDEEEEYDPGEELGAEDEFVEPI